MKSFLEPHERTGRAALRLLAFVLAVAAAAPQARAQRVNLAKYQAATASSDISTYVADFAVDGSACNFRSFRSSGRFWLEISYPQPIAIASAHVYSGLLESNTTQVLANFKFQYHNGTNWLDIPGSVVTANSRVEKRVTFDNAITATRFRLQNSDTSGNRTIRELAFFPPTNVPGGIKFSTNFGTDVSLNLAYQRPATASSAVLANIYGAGYAKNAFDGYLDNTSRWLCTTNAPGEYIEVDLLATNSIASANVHSGFMDTNRVSTQAITNFQLQYLSGTNWLPIPGASITNNTNASLRIDFATNIATSRVRLVTTSATAGRLQELALFAPRDDGFLYSVGQEVTNAAPPTNTWERFSDSYYRIRNAGTDLRIGLVDGAVVQVPVDAGSPRRTEWQLLLNYRDGTYRIRHAESGLCLATARDAAGLIGTSNNTPVVAEQYSGLPHQDWRLISANATNFALANAFSGLVIQPAGGSPNAGTPLVVAPPATNTPAQSWNAAFTRHYPKKGIAGTVNPSPFNADITVHQDYHDRFGETSWSYTWGRPFGSSFPYIGTNHVWNPMQWGNGSWTNGSTLGPPENLHRELQANPKPAYFMGFNEPDKTNQGLLSVDDAIMRWPRLEARDVPLVSPVPAMTFSEWNTNFFNRSKENGYRVDQQAVHWYAGPDASSLIGVLQKAYNDYGNRPIWLTEFSVVRWDPGTWTDKDNFDFLAEFMWRAEGLPWLKRYALFAFTDGALTDSPDLPEAPRSDAFNSDGSLTPFGQLYAGWDGVTNVVTNTTYHLHAFGSYRRGHNPGGTSAPTAVSPSNNVAGIQWILAPATTTTNTNTFRIISTRDGRPLRSANGTSVGFGTNGETGTAVEWRFVAAEYGLQYIQHPASSNKRLQLGTGSTTFSLVASNDTSVSSKWRFVRPAVSEQASLPAAPSGLTATGAVSSIALSWVPAAAATTYSVERFENTQQIWATVANGLTNTSWTNAGLPSDTAYSYRVRSANLLGTSAPSTAVTESTPHPMATLAAWQAEFLADLPPGEQDPSADPDRDGMVNLLEYAQARHPRQPDSTSPTRAASPSSGLFALRFPWNWRASGLSWRVRSGTDLGNLAAWPVAQPASVTAVRENDVDQMHLTFPMSDPDREFFYLEVISQ